MAQWQVTTRSEEETEALGRCLGELLFPGALLLLRGGLGAGKTCLARGVARGLGVPEDEPVTSPTYAVMNHYHGRCDLYHFDLYRLGGADDLEEIGFDEYARGRGVALVEWSERTEGHAYDALQISIEPRSDPERRLLIFSGVEHCYVTLLEELTQRWHAAQSGMPGATPL